MGFGYTYFYPMIYGGFIHIQNGWVVWDLAQGLANLGLGAMPPGKLGMPNGQYPESCGFGWFCPLEASKFLVKEGNLQFPTSYFVDPKNFFKLKKRCFFFEKK